MMQRATRTWICCSIATVLVGFGSSVSAQEGPWDLFLDAFSSSQCNVINAFELELVVLSDSGEFVIVTGADEVLEGSFVDVNGDVFFDGVSAGFIDFFDDADGFRTMWWVTGASEVYEIDEVNGEVFPSGFFPSEFTGALCDACLLWDDQSICEVDPPDDNPQVTISICGNGIPVSVGMIFSSLMFLRFSRRRIH